MKTKQLLLEKQGLALKQVRWCDNFFSKLRGLSFQRKLHLQEAIVLVEARDSRLNASIHMLFVRFELAVFWINKNGEVVDKVLAKPWRLSYTPERPACYVLEAHVSLFSQINVGDHVHFS